MIFQPSRKKNLSLDMGSHLSKKKTLLLLDMGTHPSKKKNPSKQKNLFYFRHGISLFPKE